MRARVLVIGGGPAGSTAARILSQSGVETVLLERDLSFVKPCGGGIPSGALEELGIPRGVVKMEVRRVKLVSPSERVAEVNLEDGFIGIVERGQFDSCLRDMAKASGARLMEGSFGGFLEAGRQVVSEVMKDGKPQTIKSDYVIAADGINSRALASLGLRPPETFYTLTAKVEAASADSCEFWLGSSHAPGFYSWVFPRPEGMTVGTGGLEGSKVRGYLESFIRKRRVPPNGPVRGYRIPLWGQPLFSIGRILFAGDAAGQVMPMSFEGIYYADSPARYEKLWRGKFFRKYFLMKKLWSYFFKDDPSMEELVSLCMRPVVQEAFIRLLLDKRIGKGGMLSFFNIFRRFLR
jgi:geranylgeranyl reductase family protein